MSFHRFFSIAALLMPLSVWAEDPAQPAPVTSAPSKASSKMANTQVLNFESDVIEGQKKAPELFLQTDTNRQALDSILYQRSNFNDFHAVDSKRRPRLADPPVSKPGR
ncbi:hypothetical protein K2X30_02100 [bacterium]|jgi:hypothetical protein|nr:hypothetical protein [bacterium]